MVSYSFPLRTERRYFPASIAARQVHFISFTKKAQTVLDIPDFSWKRKAVPFTYGVAAVCGEGGRE